VAADGCGGTAAVKAGITRSVTTTPGQACARLSTTSCPSSCPPPHAATTVMSCSWSRCRTAPRGTVRGRRRPSPESPLLQSTRRLVGQPATRADRADASPGHTGARPEPGRPPTRRRDRGEGSAGLGGGPGRPARCGCGALHGGSGTGEHDDGPPATTLNLPAGCRVKLAVARWPAPVRIGDLSQQTGLPVRRVRVT
jgi:hypothetical protein